MQSIREMCSSDRIYAVSVVHIRRWRLEESNIKGMYLVLCCAYKEMASSREPAESSTNASIYSTYGVGWA